MECLNFKAIDNFTTNRKCTLLGIGPMSKNCIDATIELANEYDVPLMIIASRRQIDAKSLGGGYVNKWSTEDFVRYVRKKDNKKNIILCRDHGGPWQNDYEKKMNLSYEEASESAKKSFLVDIKNKLQILHIDPTLDIHKKLSINEILERIKEFYEFCWQSAKKMNKKIAFEISIGQEDGGVHTLEEIEYAISKIKNFCTARNLPMPYFFVVRTGNYVMETRNVGSFESIFNSNKNSFEKRNILKIIELCNKNKIMIKEHNADYLSEKYLELHPKIGIHAVNVAPEFGVTETCAFLSLLKKNKLHSEFDKLVDLAYNSHKWEKWLLPKSKIGKQQKAIIAGHYIFSNPEFISLKNIVEKKLKMNENIDAYLKERVKDNILRYMKLFRLI